MFNRPALFSVLVKAENVHPRRSCVFGKPLNRARATTVLRQSRHVRTAVR